MGMAAMLVMWPRSFERTTEPAYTISSPEAFGSGELKKVKHIIVWNTDMNLNPLDSLLVVVEKPLKYRSFIPLYM